MKIQLQNIAFYPSTGGIESYIYNVSKKLIEIGHEPTVVCSQLKKTLPKYENYENIKIIRHPYYKIHTFPLSLLAPTYYAKRLEKFLNKEAFDYDIIWSNFFLEAFASCNAFKKKIPIIFFIHAIASNLIKRYKSYSSADIFLRSYVNNIYPQYILMEKKVIKECNKVVALSKTRAREICDLYNIDNNRVTVIPPGIDTKKFYPSEKDTNLLKELNIPENSKIILTVCRLSFEKNVETLIKSFKKISNENVFLVVVGKGAQRKYLKELAKKLNLSNKIIFTGERNDIERFYTIADLFALTSTYEGFGIVYLEAMASEVPCIGLKPDYPKISVATDEVISDGVSGFLADPYSIDDLTEKISKIINDEDLKNKLGKNARKICKDRFSWKNTAEKILEESKSIT